MKFITYVVGAVIIQVFATFALAAETATGETQKDDAGLSYAMKKSMDPNVWMKLMNGMMSGQLQGQPAIASCIDCHTSETIARYQKDFGPMLHSMAPLQGMMNPQVMMNPQTMMNPMMGMMNPQTMMNPMMGMMNPQAMMNPMMGMINPMTGMMIGPAMGMMNPMTGMMMAPAMGMMNPMTGMMNPQTMMNPMMGMMNPQTMMNPMTGIMNHAGNAASGVIPNTQQMMDPKQYEKYYRQWSEMISNMAKNQPGSSDSAQ